MAKKESKIAKSNKTEKWGRHLNIAMTGLNIIVGHQTLTDGAAISCDATFFSNGHNDRQWIIEKMKEKCEIVFACQIFEKFGCEILSLVSLSI